MPEETKATPTTETQAQTPVAETKPETTTPPAAADPAAASSEATPNQAPDIQAAVKAAVAAALAEQAAQQKQTADAAAEAERLAKLTDDQRTAETVKNLQAQLADMQQRDARNQLLQTTQQTLADRKLPISMADFLVADTAEATLQRVDGFAIAWQAALAEQAKTMFPGQTPAGGNGAAPANDYSKMSDAEYYAMQRAKQQGGK